jgi:chemotaxis family two-component system sensor kinase Cph1
MDASTQNLTASEQQFRTLAELTPFAISVTRLKDGVFLFVNECFADMLGTKVQDLLGKPAPDFYANPEDRKAIVEALKSSGRISNREVRLKSVQDGEPVWVSFSAHLSKFNDEEAIFVSLQDVSAYRRAESDLREYAENLKQSNAELEQFAYIASHDLQEPLRMIASFLQLLETRYKDKLDQDADDFINFAVDGANRLQHMINDLLVFSRVQTRGKALMPTEADKALHNALDNLEIAIQESKAEILRDRLPVVAADPSQLTMLFQHLLSNSLKFRGKTKPKIKVSVRPQDGQYEFCIEDNGIGLDPTQAERAFVIFQKLHARDAYPGTGIGLAVCKRIVARHGGRIWVESEPEKGARFLFTLPEVAVAETSKGNQ